MKYLYTITILKDISVLLSKGYLAVFVFCRLSRVPNN